MQQQDWLYRQGGLVVSVMTSLILPLYGGSRNLGTGTWQIVRPSACRVSEARQATLQHSAKLIIIPPVAEWQREPGKVTLKSSAKLLYGIDSHNTLLERKFEGEKSQGRRSVSSFQLIGS